MNNPEGLKDWFLRFHIAKSLSAVCSLRQARGTSALQGWMSAFLLTRQVNISVPQLMTHCYLLPATPWRKLRKTRYIFATALRA